jgi:hypothetical protein
MRLVESVSVRSVSPDHIQLKRDLLAADGQNTGQLTIGGYDAGKLNSATTQILNLADQSGFWKVNMGAVMVDGKVVVQGGRNVILDTGESRPMRQVDATRLRGTSVLSGTTLMYLPQADADAIHLNIKDAAPYVSQCQPRDGRFH